MWTYSKCAVAPKRDGQYYKVIAGERIAFLYRGLDGVMRQTLISWFARAKGHQEPDRWELRLEPLKRVD